MRRVRNQQVHSNNPGLMFARGVETIVTDHLRLHGAPHTADAERFGLVFAVSLLKLFEGKRIRPGKPKCLNFLTGICRLRDRHNFPSLSYFVSLSDHKR